MSDIGLDMYFFAVPKTNTTGERYRTEEEIDALSTQERGEMEYYKRPDLVEVHYWHKANAIHRWFVENCGADEDNCEPYEVHPEVLVGLYQTLERIGEDRTLAPELLPTQSGFFFGNTEYDEWYWKDVAETKEMLETQVLTRDSPVKGMRLFYQASW